MEENRIREVALCEMGCLRVAGDTGFCDRCLVQMEDVSLESLWNFETHRRPVAKSDPELAPELMPELAELTAALKTRMEVGRLLLAGAVLALAAYVVWPFVDYVAGGW